MGSRNNNDYNRPAVDTGGFAKAVESGIDQAFIQWADDFGGSISRVSTSQIRNVFGTVKKMEMRGGAEISNLLLLKPKMAYAAKRHGGNDLNSLKNALDAAIDKVVSAKDNARELDDRFRRFCQGFEAILAYHRAHGGK